MTTKVPQNEVISGIREYRGRKVVYSRILSAKEELVGERRCLRKEEGRGFSSEIRRKVRLLCSWVRHLTGRPYL